jgi:aminoglycoside phosphotransferase (APT) family kinase protein
VTAAASGDRNPDCSLASRDPALPGLPYLLDDGRLSSLLGESVQVTRVRYKPQTSMLAAFRRIRNGSFDYGWAMTRAEEGNGKLLRRELASRAHGGGIRILRPDGRRPETLIAAGSVPDDPMLHQNLAWLRENGLLRLGHSSGQGSMLPGGDSVLRYKPERRLVLTVREPGRNSVVKTAAGQAGVEQLRLLHHHLTRHGIPVLPWLGDAECAEHGISAAPSWGDGDLAETQDPAGARQAGEALARLHRIPHPGADTGIWPKELGNRLAATRSMIVALMPELERPARKLEAALGHRLLGHDARRQPMLIHGDFSADQVLVGGSEIRLIDFDRVSTGPAEADLGSFAGDEESGRSLPAAHHAGGPRTACLIQGYLREGGLFSRDAVDAWAACRLFTSSVDPFRDRSPHWADNLSWQLHRAEELIP